MTVTILALAAWPYSFQPGSAELVPVAAKTHDDGNDRGNGDGGNGGDDGESNDRKEDGGRVDFGELDDLEPMSADEEAGVVDKWD